MGSRYLDYLMDIAKEDVAGLQKAKKSYGDSWCRRGGPGAFFVMIRKLDRLEYVLEKQYNWDIFRAAREDARDEGVIDDIRDARRYLLLIEAYIRCEADQIKSASPTYNVKSGRIEQENPFGYDREIDE